MRCAAQAIGFLAVISSLTSGETVVLKNGAFFEGKIITQTSRSVRLDTRFGVRAFLRSDIQEIIPSGAAVEAGADFAGLSPAGQAILNAKTEYALGKFDEAMKRLDSVKEDADEGLRLQRDWLMIEINQRMGRFDTAKRLLKEKLENGTPPERVRAKAHLDILESNPEYDLRFVGEKHARNFIRSEELRNLAREPGALKDSRIMRLALEEYCEQMLAEDKLSVKAFAEKLNAEATYKAVKESTAREDISDDLPYMADLKNAEATLTKAQAILGDFGSPYELDLAKIEIDHLLVVVERLYNEARQASPENFDPPADNRTGQLTADGRRLWQERCDQFISSAQPLQRLLEYMQARVERFPRGLRELQEFLGDINGRWDEMIKAVKKARGRTHV